MTLDPEFSTVIEAAMVRYHIPGVAVGILANGDASSAGFGVTNLDHPLPVTADTLFQIGSITKTVTATAAMRLVEQGKLDLDTPLRSYLPQLQLADEKAAAQVTLRHCFTHTGGWVGDYFDDLSAGDDALARYVTAMAELSQVTPIGEVWSYNNAGFGLAGHVIEVVSGQPFEQAIQTLVLDPLQMDMSFFFAADIMTHRFVAGHMVVDLDDAEKIHAEVTRPWALARTTNAAGGLICSVNDMLRYARFHLGNGTTDDGLQLLSPQSMALMQSALAPAGCGIKATGIAWMINEIDGVKTVGHNGATRGQMANLLLVPERQFAAVVLTNASLGASLHRDVMAAALSRFLAIETKDPAYLSRSTGQLAEYAGYYEARLNHIAVEIQEDGLRLTMVPQGGFPKKDTPAAPAPPPIPVAFDAEDRIIATEGLAKGSKGEFLRDDTGKIVWLRFGGRVHRRQGS